MSSSILIEPPWMAKVPSAGALQQAVAAW